MAVQQASFYCPVCQQQRLFTRQRSVNHVLHLLIMVFTCGLWGIVWAILILSDDPRFHCAQCGYSDSNRYLANPYLRSQEAQANAESRLQGNNATQTVSPLLGVGIFFMPYIFGWFTLRNGYSTQARVISLGWAGFVILVNVIAIATNPSPSNNTSSSSSSNVNATQINMQNVANAATNSVTTNANKTDSSTTKPSAKQTCADIENELASVESDQARVEEMLDATEDFGPQAGSPKRAIYMNALKRKGELQLQHITLERKLKACGKRK
ncbi:MAG: hypothetical protein KF736_08970 [Acidobacteria bacterium]|nr:hypothetical protein [Acidobacteriota bacterium]MCW5950182.1 hypothetical protein [Pyrinomonadaceae bacterium]